MTTQTRPARGCQESGWYLYDVNRNRHGLIIDESFIGPFETRSHAKENRKRRQGKAYYNFDLECGAIPSMAETETAGEYAGYRIIKITKDSPT